VIVGDAVAGNHGAGAIRAPPAVHEYGTGGRVVEQQQELANLLVRRRDDSFHRHADVLHAGRLHGPSLRAGGVLVFQAQVHHRLYTQPGEALPAVLGGLTTAKDMVVDLMEVGNARCFDTCRPCG